MGLRLKSPCKINLYLNILFKRDDGFHELESIFQPIPIFDEITVEFSDDIGTKYLDIEWAPIKFL